MKPLRLFPIVGIVVIAFAGCQTVGETGPSTKAFNLGESVKPKNLEERYTQQTIWRLRDSFASRNVDGFMNNVSSGFYQGYQRLADSVQQTLRYSRDIDCRVAILSIESEGEKVTARIRWQLKYMDRQLKGPVEKRGETTLLFRQTDSLRLINFSDDSLFDIKHF